MPLDLSGVNPANVVPFTANGTDIDEQELRAHIRNLDARDCVNGIVCNGHAGQVYALSKEERARVVEIAADETADDTPIVSGIVDGSTSEALNDVKRVTDAGADGLLVIPPLTSVSDDPRRAHRYIEAVCDTADVPVVLFQLPKTTGRNYDPDLLAELTWIEGVVAIKDAVWDVDHYQEDVRAVRKQGDDVQMLVGNDEHLLPSYSLRADGTVLELAAVMPELVAELFEAVQSGDIDAARAVYQQMEPFLETVYAQPSSSSTTRLKTALKLQGVIESAAPRAPALPLTDDEIEAVEQSLLESDLLDAPVTS